ncbi:hypothetical protein DQ04_00141200 [Trypanosoma grayi]|uniref:hypothetical protein n=1 Tax=Trypanosoma grayi TaxID=71804 RepID=UPI0004F3F5D8|nr:hypothetical protein DQ04_00141200 [Trypanosoma grayi]KEG15232.1 hypothetical protein DQ04_00141200 [Trypanosoma grayi]
MLLDTLQREVEALSAELTRLRLMVYRVTEATRASPPHAARTHHIDDEYCTSRSTVSGAAAEPLNMPPQPLEGNSSSKNNNNSNAMDVMTPQLMQLLERLLIAGKGAAVASAELQKGNDAKNAKLTNRHKESKKRRHRKKKHGRRHRSTSSSSSTTSSSSSSSSSSSTSSNHTQERVKRRSHRHSGKQKDLLRHQVRIVDKGCDMPLIETQRSEKIETVDAQNKAPIDTFRFQEQQEQSPPSPSPLQQEEEEEEEEEVPAHTEGSCSARNMVRSSQRIDGAHSFSSSHSRDAVKCEEETHSNECAGPGEEAHFNSVLRYVEGTPSKEGTSGLPMDATGSRLPSLCTSQGMAGSFFGSLMATGNQESFVREMGEQQQQQQQRTFSPAAVSLRQSDMEEDAFSADENGYPLIHNNALPRQKTMPARAATTTGVRSSDDAQARFMTIRLGHTLPSRRRPLLERLRGMSDDSSASSKEKLSQASDQPAAIGAEFRSISCHSEVGDINGTPSVNISIGGRGSVEVAHASPSGSTGAGYALSMLDEYDFKLRNSFGGSESAEVFVTSKCDTSSPMLHKSDASHHF